MLCPQCKKHFKRESQAQKYCEAKCRIDFYNARFLRYYHSKGKYIRKVKPVYNVYKSPMFKMPNGKIVPLKFNPIEEPDKLYALQKKVGY